MSLVRNNPPGCRFNSIGARHGGRVVEAGREVQQRDLAGNPMTWPDSGKPRMQYVVTVDTGRIDPYIENDDGHRSLFFSGQRLHRLKEVLRAARVGDVEAGGVLFVTYASDKPSTTGGFPQKIYEVEYEAPRGGSSAGEPPAASSQVAAAPGAGAPAAGLPADIDPETLARVQAEVLARLTRQGQQGQAKRDDEPPF